MDQQGTPIGSGSGGTKNTSERAPPIQERAGAVASDSLAAESYRHQGGFSQNIGATPLSVKGASSTLANQDTSGATELRPAPDADARETQEAWNESSKLQGASGLKYPEGAGEQPDFPGAHNADGYYGGPTSATKPGTTTGTGSGGGYVTGLSNSGSGGPTSGEQYRASANAGEAPSYVGSVTGGFQTEGQLKPKGRNITEGGFDDDNGLRNASFTADVGTKMDPGRVAEQKLQRENAQPADDAGGGPRQKGVETGGVGYGNLSSDQQA